MRRLTGDEIRMVWGFVLLLAIVLLAAVIALGHVEEKTSYGLLPALTTLATLAGGFVHWAFGERAPRPPSTDKKDNLEQ